MRGSLWLTCSAGLLVLTACSIATLLDHASAKSPVPTPQQIEQVKEELFAFYKADIEAASTRDSQRELAHHLLQDAQNSSDKPVDQYAILKAAEVMALKSRDIATVLQVAEELTSHFEVDANVVRAEALLRAGKTGANVPRQDKLALSEEALNLATTSINSQRYELAAALSDLAMTWSQSARDFPQYRAAQSKKEDIKTILEERSQVIEAKRQLVDNEADLGAKSIIGRFECFVLGNWDSGLEFLRDSDDDVFSKLAARTLAGQRDGKALMELAQEWEVQSADMDGHREGLIRQFAIDLYAESLPALPNQLRETAEQKIADLQGRDAGLRSKLETVRDEKDAKVRGNPRRRLGKADASWTTFGDFVLDPLEITAFLDYCKRTKPEAIEDIVDNTNNVPSLGPMELARRVRTHEFVTQESVLIVPRCQSASAGFDSLFKISRRGVGTGDELFPSCKATTLKIVDKRRAIVRFSWEPIMLEGVDTSKLPTGEWECALLLRRVEDIDIDAPVGTKKMRRFQAVSREGFPDDVVLW